MKQRSTGAALALPALHTVCALVTVLLLAFTTGRASCADDHPQFRPAKKMAPVTP